MAKVLVTARSVAANREGREILEDAGHEMITYVGERPWSETEMQAAIKGMDAAIVGLDSVTAGVIAAGAPTLKVIARNGAGYNNVDAAAAAAAGIAVTLTPGANTLSVSELVLGLMLSLARHIPLQNAAVHQGKWGRAMGCELYGKVLGVIGTGNIGGEVIKRAHAFGMRILGVDLVERPELVAAYGVEYTDMERALPAADFVTLHLPATDQTRGMINSRTLGQMKNTAFLINTARGELINEADLFRALEKGALAGYGADTLIKEPPAVDNPLLSLSNVLLTPHCGAYTREAVARCSITAAQEVVRVLAGQLPLYPAM